MTMDYIYTYINYYIKSNLCIILGLAVIRSISAHGLKDIQSTFGMSVFKQDPFVSIKLVNKSNTEVWTEKTKVLQNAGI